VKACSQRERMKGLTIADTIGIMIVILNLIAFFTQIFPKLLDMIVELFSKTSAEAVSRQLAAFITVSGTSTYKILINYTPSKDVIYNVQGSNRLVKVAPSGTYYGESASASAPYATPPDNFGPFENVNNFIIKKTFSESGSSYEVIAEKTG